MFSWHNFAGFHSKLLDISDKEKEVAAGSTTAAGTGTGYLDPRCKSGWFEKIARSGWAESKYVTIGL